MARVRFPGGGDQSRSQSRVVVFNSTKYQKAAAQSLGVNHVPHSPRSRRVVGEFQPQKAAELAKSIDDESLRHNRSASRARKGSRPQGRGGRKRR